MKKLILSVIFALVVLTGFSATETKASVLLDEQNSLQTANDTYIYIKVFENGTWYIYIYTLDGIFVAKTEQS